MWRLDDDVIRVLNSRVLHGPVSRRYKRLMVDPDSYDYQDPIEEKLRELLTVEDIEAREKLRYAKHYRDTFFHA